MTEEIFGPILPIHTFNKIDDAINFINDREKPLTLYYFGKCNGPNKERIIRETSSGSVAINEVIMHISNQDLPFGGVGYSGIGRSHGKEGFKAFCNPKSVCIKPTTNFAPFNSICPPWTEAK